MAKKKHNNRATLDVTPDMLPMIGLLLPAGFSVAGSETMIGVVRLVLEGAAVEEDGVHLQVQVTDDGGQRSMSFARSDVKPPQNA